MATKKDQCSVWCDRSCIRTALIKRNDRRQYSQPKIKTNTHKTMKRIVIFLFSFFLLINTGFGQAKKPPHWWYFPAMPGVIQRLYAPNLTIREPRKNSDYKRAFQEDLDLINVVSKINEIMAQRGFPLKNAETVLKSLAAESAGGQYDNRKTKGGSIAESPVDKLKKTAKLILFLQLTWDVFGYWSKKSVRFNLQGLDSYSNKQVAGAQGTGEPSFSVEVAVLLEERAVQNGQLCNLPSVAFWRHVWKRSWGCYSH